MVTLTRDLDPREEGLVDEHGVLNDSGRHWLCGFLWPPPKGARGNVEGGFPSHDEQARPDLRRPCARARWECVPALPEGRVLERVGVSRRLARAGRKLGRRRKAFRSRGARY